MKHHDRLPPIMILAFVLWTITCPNFSSLSQAVAQDAWTYSDTHPAINPMPWNCPVPDPGAQLLIHEHHNWHCTWPGANTPQWGLSFIGFHRLLILDYEIWRLGLGGDRVEIWDYGPGAIIPGDDETTSSPFTHCPEFPGSSRPAGAVCAGCMLLPNSLNVLNIGSFATLGHAGAEINSSGWHGSFHVNAGAAGGSCNEVGSVSTATRDPIFWMGHKKVDDVARTWQRAKAADIVVVIDRSGSMNDDCDITNDCSGPNPPGDTGCRINAAKNAALLLADLLDDSGVDGNQHRIGLVSFASSATSLGPDEIGS